MLVDFGSCSPPAATTSFSLVHQRSRAACVLPSHSLTRRSLTVALPVGSFEYFCADMVLVALLRRLRKVGLLTGATPGDAGGLGDCGGDSRLSGDESSSSRGTHRPGGAWVGEGLEDLSVVPRPQQPVVPA